MKTPVILSSILVLGLLSACSEATFSGNAPKKAVRSAEPTATPTPEPTVTNPTETSQPTTPETTDVVTTAPVVPATNGECAVSEKKVGAQIAFIIDNSNSNSSTDCQSATVRGEYNGTKLYRCGVSTNRESAVLAAFDTLATFGSEGLSKSSIALASFPKAGDMFGGWTNQSNGWISVEAGQRKAAEGSLAFTREPFGMTPYGDAVSAMSELFTSAAQDERTKVAILVTDGEPTDRDPNGVRAKAEELRAKGIKVVVITYNETANTRLASHQAMMAEIDNKWVQGGQGHWYTSAYADFSSYIKALVGQTGLMQSLVGDGKIIEAQNSSELKNAILSVVRSEALGCTR